MENFFFGLFAITVGLLFCFRGALAFRLLIPVWGAFAGFAAGAGFIASITGGGFLQTGLAWLVGLVVALIFALFAYLYYAVAVVLVMGSIGFALGSALMLALNITWSWVYILVGLAVGVIVALGAIFTNLPMILLVVVSAAAGASAIVTGLMLLFGTINVQDFTDTAATTRIDDYWWWYLLYVALVILGIFAQVRVIGRLTATMREAWAPGRVQV